MTTPKDELEKSIIDTRNFHGRSGNWDWTLSEILAWVGILTSFLASLGSAVGWFEADALALMTGFPGLILLVNKYIPFRERYWWHVDYKYKLQALFNKLRYENGEVSEISNLVSELHVAMIADFPDRRLSATVPKEPS